MTGHTWGQRSPKARSRKECSAGSFARQGGEHTGEVRGGVYHWQTVVTMTSFPGSGSTSPITVEGTASGLDVEIGP